MGPGGRGSASRTGEQQSPVLLNNLTHPRNINSVTLQVSILLFASQVHGVFWWHRAYLRSSAQLGDSARIFLLLLEFMSHNILWAPFIRPSTDLLRLTQQLVEVATAKIHAGCPIFAIADTESIGRPNSKYQQAKNVLLAWANCLIGPLCPFYKALSKKVLSQEARKLLIYCNPQLLAKQAQEAASPPKKRYKGTVLSSEQRAFDVGLYC